jgi:hypothetical protein
MNGRSKKFEHESLHLLHTILSQVQALSLGQSVLYSQEKKIMASLTELEAQVDANTTVEGSAVVLIQGIAQQLADLIAAGADPTKLQAMVDKLNASATALSAAVAANTTPSG